MTLSTRKGTTEPPGDVAALADEVARVVADEVRTRLKRVTVTHETVAVAAGEVARRTIVEKFPRKTNAPAASGASE